MRAPAFRRTKIIFTIGPATESEEMLEKLILAGADVCRINMAHATREWTRMIIRRIRAVGERVGRPIAILMDVKGPEIRTGDVENPIELKAGETFDFTVKPGGNEPGETGEEIRSVDVNYQNLINDICVGDTVLVDNGMIQLEVLEKRGGSRIRCRVLVPGKLGSRRHINLPGVKVSLPPLTEKDMADATIGIEEGIDFVALSFVREQGDITLLRDFLNERKSPAKIVAKIEDQQAITNLEEIVRCCDGLMVARGDLGIECPFEELPIIQRRAVKLCLNFGKPVIIATHMLESMIQSPLPTRAEITDVANAVFEQADAVMLSGETTVGKYPLECVHTLDKICRRIERSGGAGFAVKVQLGSTKAKLLRSAAVMAEEVRAAGIVVFTRRGFMADGLAALRSMRCPIFAFTNSPITYKQLRLRWGVEPWLISFDSEPENTIRCAITTLRRDGRAAKGDKLVFVSDMLVRERLIDTIQLRIAE
jgi:pyruvate kinase